LAFHLLKKAGISVLVPVLRIIKKEKVKEIYKSLPKICTAAVPPVPPML